MIYSNGNHKVEILLNGKKRKWTEEDDAFYFTYDFPENMDLKINNKCDCNCPYCHENSNVNGEVPSLKKLIDTPTSFVHSLHAGTELAIGGGNIFESPDLLDFLFFLKDKGVLSNITVNYRHMMKYYKQLQFMRVKGLVRGIGVSMPASPTENDKDIFAMIEGLGSNVILHYIVGVVVPTAITRNVFNKKVLFLGYKNLRRGEQYKKEWENNIKDNITFLKNALPTMDNNNLYCYDNLALEQLDVKNVLKISDEEWKLQYQGSDTDCVDEYGNITAATMYADLVENKVARMSSVGEDKRRAWDPYNSTVEEMFRLSVEDWS